MPVEWDGEVKGEKCFHAAESRINEFNVHGGLSGIKTIFLDSLDCSICCGGWGQDLFTKNSFSARFS